MARESVPGREAAETVLFGMMEDTLHMMKCGVETLDQVAALFQAISEKLTSPDSTRDKIEDRNQLVALANLGKFAAQDMAQSLSSDRERTRRELGVEA